MHFVFLCCDFVLYFLCFPSTIHTETKVQPSGTNRVGQSFETTQYVFKEFKVCLILND